MISPSDLGQSTCSDPANPNVSFRVVSSTEYILAERGTDAGTARAEGVRVRDFWKEDGCDNWTSCIIVLISRVWNWEKEIDRTSNSKLSGTISKLVRKESAEEAPDEVPSSKLLRLVYCLWNTVSVTVKLGLKNIATYRVTGRNG